MSLKKRLKRRIGDRRSSNKNADAGKDLRPLVRADVERKRRKPVNGKTPILGLIKRLRGRSCKCERVVDIRSVKRSYSGGSVITRVVELDGIRLRYRSYG